MSEDGELSPQFIWWLCATCDEHPDAEVRIPAAKARALLDQIDDLRRAKEILDKGFV